MSNTLAPMHRQILEWYHQNGRKALPWRNTGNPYHIYVSEVMLQQTQVKTVLERFYFPFLKAFPTMEDLASASLDDVLKKWEGLGYYTRAKHLHRTAALVDELPKTIDALIKLPGIGKNTAHAIAAFAFKQPVPVMEANVKRILCRIHKLKTPSEKQLWEHAYALVDRKNPFDYNQAMMDIGATVCLPQNPRCAHCPLFDICQGKSMPEGYPGKKKKTVPLREENILISLCSSGRLSLSQRSGKFLHGLWGFESVEIPPHSAQYIGEVTHGYTHFKLRCKVYLCRESPQKQKHYFDIKEIDTLAISKADEKILKLFLLQCEKDSS